MASETEIANAALDKLGEPPLTSFDDESRGARLAKRTYADLRDALLREYPWNFAMHRAELAADEDGPEWGYTYRYPRTSCGRSKSTTPTLRSGAWRAGRS